MVYCLVCDIMKLTFKKDRAIDFYNVYNHKKDKIGIIFYYKNWKCWVWNQGANIIMSDTCLKQVIDKLKELDKNAKKM